MDYDIFKMLISYVYDACPGEIGCRHCPLSTYYRSEKNEETCHYLIDALFKKGEYQKRKARAEIRHRLKEFIRLYKGGFGNA